MWTLWLLGGVFLLARGVWEWIAPLSPDDFKVAFYVRDAAMLLPAATCWYAAILRAPEHVAGASTAVLELAQRVLARPRWAACGMAVAFGVACLAVSVLVFRTRVQIADEANYLFQAKIFAAGRLWSEPPPVSRQFFDMIYVVAEAGKWYGSFFPWFSAVLVPGIWLGIPFAVNPALGAVLLAMTVWAGARLYDWRVGLLAAALMLHSPFALFQGASYFSHVATAIPSLLAAVWILTAEPRERVRPLGAGFALGLVALSRPLSALLIALFAVLWWGVSGGSVRRTMERLVLLGLGMLPGGLGLLAYNRQLTGAWLTTPHTVALPGDGLRAGWHVLENLGVNLGVLSVDLLGVPLLSLVPLVAFTAVASRWRAPLVVLSALYMVGYALYPYHAVSYGPRFYFELLPLLLIAAARGLMALPELAAGWLSRSTPELRRAMGAIALVAPVICLVGVLPGRASVFHQRARYYDIRPLVGDVVTPPALVFIVNPDRERVYPYLAGFQLNDVALAGDTIFARDLGARNAELVARWPERQVFTLDTETRRVVRYAADERAARK